MSRRSHSALELRRKKFPGGPVHADSKFTSSPSADCGVILRVEDTDLALAPSFNNNQDSNFGADRLDARNHSAKNAFSSPELGVELRKFNSLPPSYKHRKRPFVPYKNQSSLLLEAPAPHPAAMSEPSIFQERLRELRSWFEILSEDQKLSVVQNMFPYLGARQLHWLDSQIPGENVGLHSRCSPGCDDPFEVLPSHTTLKILSFLDPVSLTRVSRVSTLWNHYSRSPTVWKNLCNQEPWKISKACTIAQIEKFTGSPSDWRGIFKERYKLRRAWLAGQSHVRTFQGHTGGISCVQFDANRIVSGSHDKTIKVWNTKTNSPWSVMTLTGHSGEVRCLNLQSNKLVSGSTDLTIKVWDLDTQPDWSSIACRVTMVGHSDTVRCVQMNLERNIVISGSYDTTLKIWNLYTGALEQTLRGHSGYVLAIHHTQGSRLISGSADKSVRIWNLDTGNCVGLLQGHKEAVTCVTMDSTESRIITGSLDRTIRLWSPQTLECERTLDWMSSEGHTGVIRDLQADDWRIISAADDKTIKVWDLATGRRLVTLKSHSDGVTCLGFNDFYIVSGSYDKTVKLWDFTVC